MKHFNTDHDTEKTWKLWMQEWCRDNQAECLAVQLPGRGMRGKEPFLPSLQEAARQLLPVVASRLQDTPYVVRYAPHHL